MAMRGMRLLEKDSVLPFYHRRFFLFDDEQNSAHLPQRSGHVVLWPVLKPVEATADALQSLPADVEAAALYLAVHQTSSAYRVERLEVAAYLFREAIASADRASAQLVTGGSLILSFHSLADLLASQSEPASEAKGKRLREIWHILLDQAHHLTRVENEVFDLEK